MGQGGLPKHGLDRRHRSDSQRHDRLRRRPRGAPRAREGDRRRRRREPEPPDFGVHTCTHIDAPAHFIDGASAAEEFPLEPLIGPAHVVGATGVDGALDRAAIERLELPGGAERVLFKTPNSDLWERDEFAPELVRLTGDGAQALIERGIRLVGLDYLSVGDPDAHRGLLGAGVIAVEGLDLRAAEPGPYRLVCPAAQDRRIGRRAGSGDSHPRVDHSV